MTSSNEPPREGVQEVGEVADADRDGVPDANDLCSDTPRSYAVDKDGCPIAIEEVARVELLVNFDFDRSEVKEQYLPEIERVARFMEQYPDRVVELEGHTDSRGTDAYNLGLSQRRAEAVMAELVGRFGISPSRVSAKGFGESQPIGSNDSAQGRAENRRVITVVIKTLQRYQTR
jgi:OOP family OmpA-OmpF porin